MRRHRYNQIAPVDVSLQSRSLSPSQGWRECEVNNAVCR